MGRFIVTRTATDVRFLLESAGGMALAISRGYKNLDACKKGIASLVADLPTAPLVDTTAGEKGPNPKIEMVGDGKGYFFLVMARNGKSVLTSPVYATRKAAKRAISMLRTAVLDAAVVMVRAVDEIPLKVKNTPYKGVTVCKTVPDGVAVDMSDAVEPSCMPFEEITASSEISTAESLTVRTEEICATVPPSAPAKPAVSRLIRVGETRGSVRESAPATPGRPAEKSPATGRSALLSRILGRK